MRSDGIEDALTACVKVFAVDEGKDLVHVRGVRRGSGGDGENVRPLT